LNGEAIPKTPWKLYQVINRVSKEAKNKDNYEEPSSEEKPEMSKNKKRKTINKPPRYFSAKAVVVMQPTETCRMYRNNTFYQREILTKCVLIREDVKTPYAVRFVHDRTLEKAKKLQIGNRITLEKARFKSYLGRKEIEVHVYRLSDTP
jgi:hypothetical protein